jgi:hypothetical protein
MRRTFVDIEVENYRDVVLREAAGNGQEKVRKQTIRALVDTKSNQVIPNPESGGKFTLDLL